MKVSKAAQTVEHGLNRPALAAGEKPGYLGFGLGLRPQHYADILDGNPEIDWFEVISENYMVPGGQPLRMLDRIRARYPIVMHGVSLVDRLDGTVRSSLPRRSQSVAEPR